MSKIAGFTGEWRFLSNFWPCWVEFEGVRYPTTEHAYQAAKTTDKALRLLMSRATTPGQVKRMGKKMQVREDWNDIREDVMRDLLIQKFSKREFSALLLSTLDMEIEETNTWNDTFWGVCRGVGQNKLGQLLMQIRADLREITDCGMHGA